MIFFLQQQTQEIVNISPILILFIGGPYGRDSRQLPLKVCKIALKTFIQKSSFNQNSGLWLSYGCLMLFIVLTWGWIAKPDSVLWGLNQDDPQGHSAWCNANTTLIQAINLIF